MGRGTEEPPQHSRVERGFQMCPGASGSSFLVPQVGPDSRVLQVFSPLPSKHLPFLTEAPILIINPYNLFLSHSGVIKSAVFLRVELPSLENLISFP